jgi:TolB-like protein/Tfp pilus assembly protein PilF
MEDRQVFDSWKEIAAYLKKTEKTCRRLEKECGLPVHRLEHSPRARVFAYKDEIDRWVEKAGSVGALAKREKTKPVRLAGWKWRLILGATALCALLIILRFRLFPPSPTAPIQSIAVLPFVDLSPGKDQEFLVDGMTEALIAQLSQISGLRRVISRTSIMVYKEVRKPLPKIAEELGVEGIVEGTIVRVGDRVRVTIQLIHAPEDRSIWAEAYERDLGDLIALQKEIARSIADRIDLVLKPEERARLAATQPVNPRAFDAVLKGNYYRDKLTVNGLTLAKGYFESAIEADPGFAQAYLGLAKVYNMLSLIVGLPPDETFPKAKAAAERALELNESLGEAHAAMAWALAMYDWDWPGADRAWTRALELQPGSSTIRLNYGWFLSWMGRHDEAVAECRRGVELDPFSARPMTSLSMVLSMARRFEEALEAARRAIELDPFYSVAFERLAEAYIGMGRYEEAIAALRKAADISGGSFLWRSVLGHACALAGRKDEAREILDELLAPSNRGKVFSEHIAWIFAGLGEKEKALQWLEAACDARDPNMVMLKVWPAWDPLRAEPRFQALLKRMKLD